MCTVYKGCVLNSTRLAEKKESTRKNRTLDKKHTQGLDKKCYSQARQGQANMKTTIGTLSLSLTLSPDRPVQGPRV